MLAERLARDSLEIAMALFTAETAAKAARLSVIARKANQTDREREELAEKQRELAAEKAGVSYTDKTLARVRLQLDKVYDAFLVEARKRRPDAAKLDKLASAQARLYEQERQLANRPLPGSLKPVVEKPKRSSPLPEPEPE